MSKKKKLVLGGDRGLNLAVGTLSDDASALIEADNVVIDAPGIIKGRRGFARNTSQTDTLGRPTALFCPAGMYAAMYVAGTGTEAGKIAPIATNGVTSGTAIASGIPFTARARTDVNVYGYDNNGQCIRHEESAAIQRTAGLPAPLFINQDTLAQLVTNAASWMVDDDAVAYRLVAKYTDSTGKVYLGPPSERVVIRKQAATVGFAIGVAQSPIIRWMWPTVGVVPTAGTEVVFQVYRTRVTRLSLTVFDPDDEMQLVYEAPFTSASYLGAQVFTFTDDAPDEALGLFDAPFLYTNPQTGEFSAYGQGLINSNTVPPTGFVSCVWRDSVWISGITDPAVQTIQLLTVSGVIVGDTLTIQDGLNSIVPIAVAGAPASALEWKIVNTGTVSSNLEKTANNICAAINLAAQVAGKSYFVQAAYIAQYGGVPGYIRITKSGATPHSRSLSVHAGTALFASKFNPDLGIVADYVAPITHSNALAFSKPNEPEAFPVAQRFFIEQKDAQIVCSIPFRASLFVFTNKGIFRIGGTSAYDYSVDQFHDTFTVFNSNCVVVCDDQIYAWGASGMLRMTESSAEYIHLPLGSLQRKIATFLLFGNPTSSMTTVYPCFVVAHQTEHKVYFFYSLDGAQDIDDNFLGCENAIVFDTRMQAFSTLSFDTGETTFFRVLCGAECQANGKLYLGEGGVGQGFRYIRSSRLLNTSADYGETLADNTNAAVPSTVKWVAAVGDPSESKLWMELQVYFNIEPVFAMGAPGTACGIIFTPDGIDAGASYVLPPANSTYLARQVLPNTLQRSTRMQVTLTHEAIEYFALEGMALTYDSEDTRITRATTVAF